MSAKPLTDAVIRDMDGPIRAAPQPGSWEQSTVKMDVALALLLRMLRRRKWLLAFAVVTVPLLTWVATLHMTERYTASADIVLQPQQLNIQDIQSVLAQAPASSDIVASEIEILSSRALGAQVVERLQLYRLPEFNADLRPPSFREQVVNSVSNVAQRWLGRTLWPDSSDDDSPHADAGHAATNSAADSSDSETNGKGAASDNDSATNPEVQDEAANTGTEIDEADIINAYLNSLKIEVLNNSRVVEV